MTFFNQIDNSRRSCDVSANWCTTGIDVRRESRENKRAKNKSIKLKRRARKAEATKVAKPKKATNNKDAKGHTKSYRKDHKTHQKGHELPDYKPEEINQEVREFVEEEDYWDSTDLTCKSGECCLHEKDLGEILNSNEVPYYGNEFYIKDFSSTYDYCQICLEYMDEYNLSDDYVEWNTYVYVNAGYQSTSFVLKPNQYVLVKRNIHYEANWQYGCYYGFKYHSIDFEFEIYDNKPVLSDIKEETYGNHYDNPYTHPCDNYKVVADQLKIIGYDELMNILNKKNKSIPLSNGYSIIMNGWQGFNTLKIESESKSESKSIFKPNFNCLTDEL